MDFFITSKNKLTGEENPQFIYEDEDVTRDDTYYYLSSENEICRILEQIISDPYLCKKIVNLKKEIEEFESRKYHIEMWVLVASAYFKGIDRTTILMNSQLTRQDSYILNMASNNTEYHVCKDITRDYYELTNVSYQVRELIISLIKEYSKDNRIGEISDKERMQWMKFDDKYYGVLAKKIMNAMNAMNAMEE